LKPLEDAIRNGDPIRAVIRGSGINQDGRTAGITLPSREAQASLIRRVYNKAGLNPLDTAYVEAHGTGTPAGDPLEAGAIASVFGERRAKNRPLLVGSVKTNIGHLEAASGLASVMKSVLILEKGLIPPNLNFEKVNPQIPLEKWKMMVTISSVNFV
jgi:acyl transferase domain-containing protein